MEYISNSELIDRIYDSAGDHLRNTVTDWSNYMLWRSAVKELNNVQQTVYLIGVLNQQVMNGGLCQYFDNSYGIFGYETLKSLREVGANQFTQILEQALKIVNPQNLSELEFSRFIAENVIDDEDMEDKLDELDDQYYELEGDEDLEVLLATWIKTHPKPIT
ncbi:DMP19 family protein [Marinoscillum pacificum]|uniref:DMP19 family protein n=1 Tax=Marinoscillum pacificum TaxID=392723 RepID=UPI00215827B3|nr:DMP19 family protein [Marinoscillum pacificum]